MRLSPASPHRGGAGEALLLTLCVCLKTFVVPLKTLIMKTSSFFFLALLALCLCACNNSVPDDGKSEEPVFRIVQDTLRLSVGQASMLSLSVPLSGVEWASSVDSVAVVDWRGKVSAKSAGLSLVTASRLSSSDTTSLLVSDTCVVFVLSAD